MHLTPIKRCLSISTDPYACTDDFRYFEGGSSSVYLWDLDDGGFAGVILFKKGVSLVRQSSPALERTLTQSLNLLVISHSDRGIRFMS